MEISLIIIIAVIAAILCALGAIIAARFSKVSREGVFRAYVLARLEDGNFLVRNFGGNTYVLPLKKGECVKIGTRVMVREVYRIGPNGKDVFPAIAKPKCYVITQEKNALQAQLVQRLDKRFVICSLNGNYIIVACTPEEQLSSQTSVPLFNDLVYHGKPQKIRRNIHVLMLPVCDDGSIIPIRKSWLV